MRELKDNTLSFLDMIGKLLPAIVVVAIAGLSSLLNDLSTKVTQIEVGLRHQAEMQAGAIETASVRTRLLVAGYDREIGELSERVELSYQDRAKIWPRLRAMAQNLQTLQQVAELQCECTIDLVAPDQF